ncbi:MULTISPECIES: single-stranded DNA-binding protein [unclassified Chelatococcus]|uniref:single-stranded DNA-binding protein n=1 Tax=unclassified Chelatococcus TaxID=2638111 RepID=UPI0024BEB917|nr:MULTISPECIES: single-stranded DNA-binding protein [unclassified Chelatococcus]
MAGSVNKVILLGHLGRDPEARRGNDGNPIVNFRMATSETWRDKATGERRERAEWHSVVVFNENLAKIAEQYLRKGSKVYVEGQLQTRKWQDKDGQDRYTTEVVLQRFRGEITLLDSQRNGPPPADDPDQYGTTSTRDSSAGGNAYADRKTGKYSADLDDDIPF